MNGFATRLALAADILRAVGVAVESIAKIIEDYAVADGMKEVEPR